jgi:shikimate dehydrogenase
MKIYGLLGKTLKHSFSKAFFEKYFQEHKIEGEYINFEIEDISQVGMVFDTPNLAGLNVTIPYKESVIPFLDGLTEEAKEIGAVNVVQFKDGKKIGHNTDAFGFHQSMKPFLTNEHERALVLGTGGASKAVVHVFKSLGVDVLYASRNPEGEKVFGYDEINQYMLNACKVIINCTPVGMFPNSDEILPIPFEFLTDKHLVIDLIYNPAKTKFLQLAESNQATILNGESMLHHQAIKAWEIWNS